MQVKLQRKIRQGRIRPESSVDLHGCRQAEALALLEDFLADALQRRCRMLLIVHGQGYRSSSEAVLKPLVKHWLSEQPQVLAWCPAQARDGAGGASYVYLRN
jgi:DNA-nicking Smr family endonuclease